MDSGFFRRNLELIALIASLAVTLPLFVGFFSRQLSKESFIRALVPLFGSSFLLTYTILQFRFAEKTPWLQYGSVLFGLFFVVAGAQILFVQARFVQKYIQASSSQLRFAGSLFLIFGVLWTTLSVFLF